MSFAVHHPTSIGDAVALAREFGEKGRFIAGGTDLIVQINRRSESPAHLIDLTGLAELCGIGSGPDALLIGALTTHKMIERHPALQGPLAAVAEAARVVGGHQVRNVGTVGGNIANASPAADAVVPLVALEAAVALEGPDGQRNLALEDLLLRPGQTACRRDELIRHIRIDRLPARSATAFLKAGRRKAMEISIVCVAARLTLDAAEQHCEVARIALGAVGATCLRPRAAERALEGSAATDHAFREAARIAAGACSPIDDVRASAEYRRLLVEALVARALHNCVQRIRERRR
jgi:carbon-monoxide dehydrogenase medium subunit